MVFSARIELTTQPFDAGGMRMELPRILTELARRITNGETCGEVADCFSNVVGSFAIHDE